MSKIVCKNIIMLRQTRGISQVQLAAKLNLTAPALSKIENGVTTLSVDRLLEIASELGTTASVLIGEAEEVLPNNYMEEINALREMMSKKDTEILMLHKKLINLYEDKLKLKKIPEFTTSSW